MLDVDANLELFLGYRILVKSGFIQLMVRFVVSLS
jgi:hypothetical protein